jgi:hypothetical protein
MYPLDPLTTRSSTEVKHAAQACAYVGFEDLYNDENDYGETKEEIEWGREEAARWEGGSDGWGSGVRRGGGYAGAGAGYSNSEERGERHKEEEAEEAERTGKRKRRAEWATRVALVMQPVDGREIPLVNAKGRGKKRGKKGGKEGGSEGGKEAKEGKQEGNTALVTAAGTGRGGSVAGTKGHSRLWYEVS